MTRLMIPRLLTPGQRTKLKEALELAEPAPWKVVDGKKVGDDWLLAWGTDENGTSWGLTTSNLRASECRGNGPKADASAAALALNYAGALLEESRLLRELCESQQDRQDKQAGERIVKPALDKSLEKRVREQDKEIEDLQKKVAAAEAQLEISCPW